MQNWINELFQELRLNKIHAIFLGFCFAWMAAITMYLYSSHDTVRITADALRTTDRKIVALIYDEAIKTDGRIRTLEPADPNHTRMPTAPDVQSIQKLRDDLAELEKKAAAYKRIPASENGSDPKH